MKRQFKKLGLVYIREKGCTCIQHPHYDLYEDNGLGTNTGYAVACILAYDKDTVKLLKKWVKENNHGL